MSEFFAKLCDGFAILGFVVVVLGLLVCLVHIFFVLKYTIRDTIKYPVNYKLPFVFLENLWDQIVARWHGYEVEISPAKKD